MNLRMIALVTILLSPVSAYSSLVYEAQGFCTGGNFCGIEDHQIPIGTPLTFRFTLDTAVHQEWINGDPNRLDIVDNDSAFIAFEVFAPFPIFSLFPNAPVFTWNNGPGYSELLLVDPAGEFLFSHGSGPISDLLSLTDIGEGEQLSGVSTTPFVYNSSLSEVPLPATPWLFKPWRYKLWRDDAP